MNSNGDEVICKHVIFDVMVLGKCQLISFFKYNIKISNDVTSTDYYAMINY